MIITLDNFDLPDIQKINERSEEGETYNKKTNERSEEDETYKKKINEESEEEGETYNKKLNKGSEEEGETYNKKINERSEEEGEAYNKKINERSEEEGETYNKKINERSEEEAAQNIPPEAELLPLAPAGQMPQILNIDVQCQKETMAVRIEFSSPFNGVIYSKGYYSNTNCIYVVPNNGRSVYEFTVYLDRCGTQFVDQFNQGGQAYLENTIIIQNEPGFQEVWDTARHIRCLWTGQFEKTVTSNINVDMLDIISITYSGDSVDSYMDIQVGRGPFAVPVTGLVRIGDTLTAVIYVQGTDNFDIHVKECTAHSGDVSKGIQLTDVRGCVIKKKLMGPWQKTRQTGNTGASIIAYSFFQAFKFPDTMEVFLECNIEICKFQCQDFCSEFPQARTGRRKRDTRGGVKVIKEDKDGILRLHDNVEPIRLLRGIRVVAPEDIIFSESGNGTVSLTTGSNGRDGDVCMSTPSFVTALVVTILILLASSTITAVLCIRIRNIPSSHASTFHSYSQRDLLNSLGKP
ncbi:uncharacterized protein LOC106465655 [Limulus polyphemus]|uniref:Uncharacterized protein LOC106465655 n=1 Tax=Limulus polyphemus TaxID=6850 RepID=A0ABM1T095_LIMPO|nr:uncharacterized protein LOC106465655 [Limulus polyphemus]